MAYVKVDGLLKIKDNQSEPSTDANYGQQYVDSVGNLYFKNPSGAVARMMGLEDQDGLTYNIGGNFQSASTPYMTPMFYKVGFMVYVYGAVRRTSGSATWIGSVPSGFDPAEDFVFTVPILDGSWSNAIVRFENDGTVDILDAGGASGAFTALMLNVSYITS